MKSLIIFFFLVALPMLLSAQDKGKTKFPLEKFYVERKKNPVSFLRDFRFGASIGAGNTYLSHSLPGFGIYQPQGQQPVLFDTAGLGTTSTPTIGQLSAANRYANWINDVTTAGAIPLGSPVIVDRSSFTGRGNALSIPLRVTIHYEYKQFRVGAGYSYEFMSLGNFNLTAGGESSYQVTSPASAGFMSKYFGILGYSFYRWDKYLVTVDANIGNFTPGANFNNALIQKSLYYNLGLTMERDFSEYLKAFVRPSFDYKSYSIGLGASGKGIDHSMNALYVNVGFTYSIPELPRCYDKSCRIQINHAHGNREYRSRVHKIWKVQNPGYGENDPVLIKYKGKNKRKLNPY